MKNVAIVGTGLIGASFGLALRKAGFSGPIVGVSSARAIADALASAPSIAARRWPKPCAGARPGLPLADHRPHSRYPPPSRSPGAPGRWSPTPAAPSAKSSIWRAQTLRAASFWAAIPWPARRSAAPPRPMPDSFSGRTWVLTPDEPAELETPAALRLPRWLERIGARVGGARCGRARPRGGADLAPGRNSPPPRWPPPSPISWARRDAWKSPARAWWI